MTLREMITTKGAYLGNAEEAGLVTRIVPMLALDDEGIAMEAFQYGVFDIEQTNLEEAMQQVKKVRKQIEDAKLSKKEVSYESPAEGMDHCEDCRFFIAKNKQCQKVAGPIQPRDWCDKFEARK